MTPDGQLTTKTPRTGSLVLVLAWVAALLCIAWPLLQGRIYASFDAWSDTMPLRVFYALSLEQGEWGFWIPHWWRGFPHLGGAETGIFHPLHYLIYSLLPVAVGFCVELMLHFLLSFAGMWLLLRRAYRLRSEAALAGAAWFSFSLFSLAHFGHVHLCWIVAHIPYLVLTAEGVIRRYRPGLSALGFGLLIASMLLLCHPQTVYLSCLAAGVLILARLLLERQERRQGLLLAIIVLTVAGFAGAMIGSLQLLPSIAALQDSTRGGLSPEMRQNFSLHPLALATNLSPGLFADHVLGDIVVNASAAPIFSSNISEFSAYFGLSLWVVIIGGLVAFRDDLRQPRVRLIACVAAGAVIVSGLLMLGRYGGLNALVGYLPLVADFRSPDRYKIIVMVVVILTAALIIHRLTEGTARSLTKAEWAVILIPFALSVVIMLWALSVKSFTHRGTDIPLGSAMALVRGPLIAALAVGFFALALRGQRWAITALAVLCLLDMLAYGVPLVKGVDSVPATRIAEARQQMMTQDDTYRMIALDNWPMWEGYQLATGSVGMEPALKIDLSERDHMRLIAIRWGRNGATTVELPNPLSRFRLVPTLLIADDPIAAIAQPGIDLATTAVTAPGTAEPLAGAPLTDGDMLTRTGGWADRQTFRVTATEPRLLVIADRFDPGWQASLNGQPTTLIPLFSGALRGVVVPAGQHDVMLAYHPPGLRTARFLAIAGLACLLLLLSADWWLPAFRQPALEP